MGGPDADGQGFTAHGAGTGISAPRGRDGGSAALRHGMHPPFSFRLAEKKTRRARCKRKGADPQCTRRVHCGDAGLRTTLYELAQCKRLARVWHDLALALRPRPGIANLGCKTDLGCFSFRCRCLGGCGRRGSRVALNASTCGQELRVWDARPTYFAPLSVAAAPAVAGEWVPGKRRITCTPYRPGSAERSGERGRRSRDLSMTTPGQHVLPAAGTALSKFIPCPARAGRRPSRNRKHRLRRPPLCEVGPKGVNFARKSVFLLDRARPVFFGATKENGGCIPWGKAPHPRPAPWGGIPRPRAVRGCPRPRGAEIPVPARRRKSPSPRRCADRSSSPCAGGLFSSASLRGHPRRGAEIPVPAPCAASASAPQNTHMAVKQVPPSPRPSTW